MTKLERGTPAANALAVAFEQLDDLVDEARLRSLMERAADTAKDLHIRFMDESPIITFSVRHAPSLIVQVEAMSDDALVRRMAYSVALVLWANSGFISRTIDELGDQKETALQLLVTSQRELRVGLSNPRLLPDTDRGSPMLESNMPFGKPQPGACLIVHDDYAALADWATHPENKTFVWLLMNVFRVLVSHCTHAPRDYPTLARRGREFCEAVLL